MEKKLNFYDKKDLYIAKAREFFPDFNFSSSFAMYSGECDAPASAKVKGLTKSFNHNDIGTKNIELAHYTSIDSLLNIINSKNVRLYNCNNLNDTKELIFAAKKFDLPLTEEEISEFRRQHFVLSTCKVDKENREDFNMWRLYGQNGKGVCIQFETDPMFSNWSGIIANEVTYLDDLTPSVIREFFKFHFSFQEEYKIFQNTPNFIPLLLLFNKEKIWSIENEFRILASCSFDKYSSKINSTLSSSSSPWLSKTLKHTVNSSGNLVSYLELPIEVDPNLNKTVEILGKEINVSERYPHLKIKRVVIGYDVSEKMQGTIIKWLMCQQNTLQFEVIKSAFSN